MTTPEESPPDEPVKLTTDEEHLLVYHAGYGFGPRHLDEDSWEAIERKLHERGYLCRNRRGWWEITHEGWVRAVPQDTLLTNNAPWWLWAGSAVVGVLMWGGGILLVLSWLE